jgi:hypothetical protein
MLCIELMRLHCCPSLKPQGISIANMVRLVFVLVGDKDFARQFCDKYR